MCVGFAVKAVDAWLADDYRWDLTDTRMYFKLLRLPGQAPLVPVQVCTMLRLTSTSCGSVGF